MITACDGGCPCTLFHRLVLQLNANEHFRTLLDSTMQLCKCTRGLPHHTQSTGRQCQKPCSKGQSPLIGAHLERLVRKFCGTLCAIGIFTSLQTKIVASPIELHPRVETVVCHCRACCFPRTKLTELICSCLNISARRTSHLNKAVRILHKKQRLAFSPRNLWGSGSKLRPRKPRILGTFRGAMHRR